MYNVQEAIQTIEASFQKTNETPTGENIFSDGLTHNADLRQTWNKLNLTFVSYFRKQFPPLNSLPPLIFVNFFYHLGNIHVLHKQVLGFFLPPSPPLVIKIKHLP